jgi:hypothetical protein
MKRTPLLVLAASLLVAPALAGCSDSAGGGGPGVTADGGGGSETTGGGDGGALADGQDAGPTVERCLADGDCTEPGAICACTGECVVPTGNPCNDDKNCGPGLWCDPCIGRCAARVALCDPCAESGACEGSGLCLPFASGGNYCSKACVADAGCPIGYSCAAAGGGADKQCVPKSGDCTDLGLCEDDGQCPDGQICSDALKVCAPGCNDDQQCSMGQVCVRARCVPKCASVADCGPGEECTVDGRCKIPGACESSAECLDPETYCNKSTGMCTPGCLVDSDCQDAAKVCKNLTCIAKGCEHNYQCQHSTECDKTSGACVPMTRDHCAVCDASAENQCGGDPSLCVTFQTEDPATGETVEQGDFCLLTCDDDPIDQCPSGYGCQHIENPDAGIDGFYCVRQCYQEVVVPQP